MHLHINATQTCWAMIPKTGDILDLATMRVLGAAGAVLAGAGVVLAFVQYLKRKENEE